MEHRHWSVVENRRVADGRVVQHHLLYLEKINDAQRAAWCPSISVFDEDTGGLVWMALGRFTDRRYLDRRRRPPAV